MRLTKQQKAIFEEWELSLTEFNKFGDDTAILKFKEKYPSNYTVLRSMNQKRISIKDTIEPLLLLGEKVYWFTLTFNDLKGKNSVDYKRKEAMYFLNKISPLFLLVEEYGEKNTKRYHLHGFCVPKYCYDYDSFFNEFAKWHSRKKLYLCKDLKQGLKKVKYISKYIVKDVPRIRRSKPMSKLYNYYKSIKKLRRSFPSLLYETLYKFYASNITIEYMLDGFFDSWYLPF